MGASNQSRRLSRKRRRQLPSKARRLLQPRFRRVRRQAARSPPTVQANPSFSVAHAYLVASQVGRGDMPAAHVAASRLLEIAPMFTVAAFVQMGTFRGSLMEGLAAALRTAGLPET